MKDTVVISKSVQKQIDDLPNDVIPFHFNFDTFRQAEEQGSRGAEEKLFVSFI